MTTLRGQSKQEWNDESGTFAAISCGSLQRIADAVEVMSRSYAGLIADRDRYERLYREERERREQIERSRNALRGALARAKWGRR